MFRDQPQDVGEEDSRNGDLGHLEGDIAGMAHDLRADLDQLFLQASGDQSDRLGSRQRAQEVAEIVSESVKQETDGVGRERTTGKAGPSDRSAYRQCFLVAVGDITLRLSHRLMGGALRSKAVGGYAASSPRAVGPDVLRAQSQLFVQSVPVAARVVALAQALISCRGFTIGRRVPIAHLCPPFPGVVSLDPLQGTGPIGPDQNRGTVRFRSRASPDFSQDQAHRGLESAKLVL